MSGQSVALAAASCYPEGLEAAFRYAAELGYDGLEVMVWREQATQSVYQVAALSRRYGVPVVSIHAPTLLLTRRVWGNAPWPKIDRSVAMAEALGAGAIVIHPPFSWQRGYAREFVAGIAERQQRTEVRLAIENMFPWRARGVSTRSRDRQMYRPHWNPVTQDYRHVTLDLSHAAISDSDPLQMARELSHRLAHVHLTDSNGSNRDEHLVPGRGTQPAAELLQLLPSLGFDGAVVVELSTRGMSQTQRREALAESLDFARRHLRPAPRPTRGTARATVQGGGVDH